MQISVRCRSDVSQNRTRHQCASPSSTSMSKYIPLILAVVTTNAISQLLLKHGMNGVGRFKISGDSLLNTLLVVAVNPWVVGGLTMLVFSTGLHLTSLSRVDLSFAYPFLSVAYVLVLIASHYLFGESLSTARIAGVGLICLGTFFVARS